MHIISHGCTLFAWKHRSFHVRLDLIPIFFVCVCSVVEYAICESPFGKIAVELTVVLCHAHWLHSFRNWKLNVFSLTSGRLTLSPSFFAQFMISMKQHHFLFLYLMFTRRLTPHYDWHAYHIATEIPKKNRKHIRINFLNVAFYNSHNHKSV